MQPQLCSRCKKNVAVVFITRMENGKNINEGLCLKCAKNLGLPQVNEMMQRMGITDEDLDNISNEMMSAFGGAENLEGIDAPDGDDEEDGKTAVAVFREKTPLGLIAMRDEPRADAKDAVRQLTAMGVTAVILTGDNPRTAAAIAGSLGLKFEADMMPEDKLAYIREIGTKGGVMMIGDGINDAPALKQASVGVAMGSGTDVALETADAAILRDRVTDIPATIRMSRAAMANIRQNVTIALGLKAVFLVTSVFGLTGLWIAILADTGATVLVTLNALRLLRFNPEREG